MGNSSVVDMIKSGERSRLIPVVADMSKEERAVSPVLAVFSVVPAFANSMLDEVGGPTNQRARIKCFSQVVFKDGPTDRKLRPDGLIIVDSGRKIWSALVEAKVGNSEISGKQIEDYLDIARHLGINAVITISNQFAPNPTHHPVSVNKQKLRSVELYHFSWLALLTKATLIGQSKQVDDPEQAFILRELIRFLNHTSSGICEMSRMSGSWKDVCMKVQTGTPIAKGDPAVLAAVADWHQLSRFLALDLSVAVGRPVSVWMPKSQLADPMVRRNSDVTSLTTMHTLEMELNVPGVASRITVQADFLRRSVRFSTTINTPQDKSRPTAAITWLTRQLPLLKESTDTLLRVHWSRRTPDTVVTIAEAIRDPKSAAPDNRKELPISVDVQRVVDLATRFKGAATFVEDIKRELPKYYRDVVQNVSNWVAKPPKLAERPELSPDNDVVEVIQEVEAVREASSADSTGSQEPILE
jgi:hypothetical protein